MRIDLCRGKVVIYEALVEARLEAPNTSRTRFTISTFNRNTGFAIPNDPEFI